MDNIFAQITFDTPLSRRSKVYSNLSVVADNWCEPAREILVRDVVIQDWQKLSETMPEWAGALVRTFTMDVSVFEREEWNGSGRASRRLFKLISNMPNLRSLEIRELPFSRFDHRDVSYMRSTLLLPSLTRLSIYNENTSMRWMLADLLATSGNVSSLEYFDDTDGSFTAEEVDGFGMFDDLGDDLGGEERLEFGGDSDGSSGSDDDASAPAHPSPAEARIDFGGKMRELDASSEHVESTFCEQMRSMGGLAGLVELDIGSGFVEAEKVEELFRVIGPTLAKIRIDALVGAISPHLSLLRTLTHLRFTMIAPDYPAVVALPHFPPSTSTTTKISSPSFKDGLVNHHSSLRLFNTSKSPFSPLFRRSKTSLARFCSLPTPNRLDISSRISPPLRQAAFASRLSKSRGGSLMNVEIRWYRSVKDSASSLSTCCRKSVSQRTFLLLPATDPGSSRRNFETLQSIRPLPLPLYSSHILPPPFRRSSSFLNLARLSLIVLVRSLFRVISAPVFFAAIDSSSPHPRCGLS